ncbi:Protein BOI2 [Fusarium oxysporum f. sp. albedinis]|nr:Protein BOI2 [Fusarium oxysporum f. sp. albedinis]
MYLSVASCLPTNRWSIHPQPSKTQPSQSQLGSFPLRRSTNEYSGDYARNTRISADRIVSTAVANNKRSDSMVNSLSSAHDDPLSRVMALSVV